MAENRTAEKTRVECPSRHEMRRRGIVASPSQPSGVDEVPAGNPVVKRQLPERSRKHTNGVDVQAHLGADEERAEANRYSI